MAIMAAQAPLAMANPMAMFGFNPANYSAALEASGFPSKRFNQLNKDILPKSISNNNKQNSLLNFVYNNKNVDTNKELMNKIDTFYDN